MLLLRLLSQNEQTTTCSSLQGRPYTDKMKWDRIEMLHWLQEERKQNAIRYEAIMREIPLKNAHLEPLNLAIPAQKVM